MTQLYLYNNRSTTIPAVGAWAATTGFPIPSWAPDIAHIGNTVEEPHNVCASTSGIIRGGLGDVPFVARMRQASERAYRIEGTDRSDHGSYRTVILHYRAVGELTR